MTVRRKQTECGELYLSADHHSVVKTLLPSGTSSHALHLALVFIFVQLHNFSGIKTVSQTHSFSLLTVFLLLLSGIQLNLQLLRSPILS